MATEMCVVNVDNNDFPSRVLSPEQEVQQKLTLLSSMKLFSFNRETNFISKFVASIKTDDLDASEKIATFASLLLNKVYGDKSVDRLVTSKCEDPIQLESLLKLGANPNQFIYDATMGKVSVLHMAACRRRSLKDIQLLLNHGADPKGNKLNRKTPVEALDIFVDEQVKSLKGSRLKPRFVRKRVEKFREQAKALFQKYEQAPAAASSGSHSENESKSDIE